MSKPFNVVAAAFAQGFPTLQLVQVQEPKPVVYERAMEYARALLDCGIEPTSALKQGASDAGIPYGAEMGEFVSWAEGRL